MGRANNCCILSEGGLMQSVVYLELRAKCVFLDPKQCISAIFFRINVCMHEYAWLFIAEL